MPERNGESEPVDLENTAAIQADIDRTRTELGDTAAALGAKLDVPTQVREKVEETKQEVRARTEPLRRNAVPIGFGVVVLALLVRRRRVRRSRSQTDAS